MDVITRNGLSEVRLPGRIVWKAFGKDAAFHSEKMTIGYASYSAESGPMAPHRHAEEAILVLDSNKSWVRSGNDPKNLSGKTPLEAGMLLHFPDREWHVFEYDEGGHLDIVFFYAQVDDIRPEEGSR